jgi:hypothetical protein
VIWTRLETVIRPARGGFWPRLVDFGPGKRIDILSCPNRRGRRFGGGAKGPRTGGIIGTERPGNPSAGGKSRGGRRIDRIECISPGRISIPGPNPVGVHHSLLACRAVPGVRGSRRAGCADGSAGASHSQKRPACQNRVEHPETRPIRKIAGPRVARSPRFSADLESRQESRSCPFPAGGCGFRRGRNPVNLWTDAATEVAPTGRKRATA